MYIPVNSIEMYNKLFNQEFWIKTEWSISTMEEFYLIYRILTKNEI